MNYYETMMKQFIKNNDDMEKLGWKLFDLSQFNIHDVISYVHYQSGTQINLSIKNDYILMSVTILKTVIPNPDETYLLKTIPKLLKEIINPNCKLERLPPDPNRTDINFYKVYTK